MGKKAVREKQERAANAIRRAFLHSIEILQSGAYPWFREVGAYYRVKKLRNGGVDGMMRIASLPESIEVSELLFDLQDAGVFNPPAKWKVWVSVGFIGSFAEPPEQRKRKRKRAPGAPKGMKQVSANIKRYDRFAGMEKVSVYSQRKEDLQTNIVTARDMAEKLEGKDKRPEQILFRIYWEPKGNRPKRKRRKVE